MEDKLLAKPLEEFIEEGKGWNLKGKDWCTTIYNYVDYAKNESCCMANTINWLSNVHSTTSGEELKKKVQEGEISTQAAQAVFEEKSFDLAKIAQEFVFKKIKKDDLHEFAGEMQRIANEFFKLTLAKGNELFTIPHSSVKKSKDTNDLVKTYQTSLMKELKTRLKNGDAFGCILSLYALNEKGGGTKFGHSIGVHQLA